MGWSDKFNYPIKWGARSIHTLHEAHLFILGLSGYNERFRHGRTPISWYYKQPSTAAYGVTSRE